MEAFGKLVKEGFDVTLLGDGLADLEKCLKLPCGRLERRGSAGSIFRFRHKNENSIGLGRVTTEGMRGRGRRSFVYSGREYGSRDVVTMDEFPLKRKMALSSARRRAIFLLALGLSALYGCGQSPAPETRGSEETRPAGTERTSRAPERHDLARDEERGGHTLARHVARTDEELEERLRRERNISAASTWNDQETAEEVGGEALKAERGRIESWMRRGYPRANLALHYDAGRDIGRSLRRGESQSVACRSAVIVLRADGPDSFYVLTAYPEARE